jgi:hypothetical protein
VPKFLGIAEEERDDLIARLEALEAERLEAVQDVQLLRKAITYCKYHFVNLQLVL